MKKISYLPIAIFLLAACANNNAQTGNNNTTNNEVTATQNPSAETGSDFKGKHFEGVISNGFKGDKISFDISADGKKLENLTFTGYWRCAMKLEQTTVGPDGAFEVKGNKVSGHITEPPGGGSTAWRFELDATLNGNKAEGSFRMNINNLGCDTYKLQWTATAK